MSIDCVKSLTYLTNMANNYLEDVPSPPSVLADPGYYSNPSGAAKATASLKHDSWAALSLALMYKLQQGEHYAEAAVNYLKAWATTCKKLDGFDARLTMAYNGLSFLEAFTYIRDHDADLTPLFYDWVKNVYQLGCQSLYYKDNNPGSWGRCGNIYADFIMNKNVLSHVTPFIDHIKKVVNPLNGDLYLEDRRTNSGIWYTAFALEAMTKVLFIFKQTNNGDHFKLLVPAYFMLSHYCQHPEEWPYALSKAGIFGRFWRIVFPCANTLEVPVPGQWPSGLLDILSCKNIITDPSLENYLNPVRPIGEGCAFRFSTLKWCFNIAP